MSDNCPIEQFLPPWIEGKIWDRLANWGDHVTSWLSTAAAEMVLSCAV